MTTVTRRSTTREQLRSAGSPTSGRSTDRGGQPVSFASTVTVLELMDRARDALLDACHSSGTTQRYTYAQLGALRAATAIATSAAREGRGSRRRDVWARLAASRPELAEWSGFFALTSERAAAAERGRTQLSTREADDLVRQAEMFMELVLSRLGLPMNLPLPQCASPLRRT